MKRKILAVCVVLLAFAAQASAATIYGVNAANQLIRFRNTAPGTLELQVAITGLQPGESVLGIDFRPANRQLYALGSSGRLYTLDQNTGAATLVAALTADPTDETNPYVGLVGTEFGFDFNPVADRIRVVSDADQNLRIHPDTGVVISDNPLAFAATDTNAGDNPSVTGSAYTNSFPGATTTTLYGIDTLNDVVVMQNPNEGTLTTFNSLSLGNIEAVAGFDIGAGTGTGLLAYSTPSNPSASFISTFTPGFCCGSINNTPIGGGSRVRSIAVAATSSFRLSAGNYVVDETGGSVTISVFRFGDTTTSAQVGVFTTDGTAVSPFDYSSINTSIFFSAGETVKQFSISITNNAIAEGTETFTVSLTNPSSSEPVTLDSPRTATVTITEGSPMPTPSPTTVTVFGVSLNNRLFSFRSTNPGTIDYSVAITGLQPGEGVINIDVRPANAQLYALTNGGRLYTLDTISGAATLVAALTADPTDETNPYVGLVGTEFGFDFNPVADRIRVVSDADQNLRIHPDTGVVISDNPIAYSAGDPNAGRNPSAVAAAYNNPDNDPATGTTLYDIEVTQDMLVTQNPPNEGTLNTVGPLGSNLTERVGFDIAPDNTGYITHTPQGGSNTFSRVSLTTGVIQCCGSTVGFPDVVRDIAVAPGNVGVLQFDPTNYAVDEGAGSVAVSVTRTGGSSGTVAVNYTTSPGFGAATPGQDYTTVTGTLTFGPGETVKTFNVPILEDAMAEGSEQFNVLLSGPAGGAALGTSTGTITILDNETTPPGTPTLTIDDVIVAEGDAGTIAVFTVTLSVPRNATTTVQYITSSGTATAGADYESVSGTLTFAAGQTTRTITVPVNGDDAPEGAETFFVNLSNPIGANIGDAQGQATINDDDIATAAFSFSAASFADDEDAAAILVTVNRTGDLTSTMTVDYLTSNGTASDRTDYTFAAGTLEFAPGESSKTIPVLISEDSHVEGTETLTITLLNPRGGGGLGGQPSATVVIIDDPSEPAANAIDDTNNFVIQHYHDFLNRQPDAGGLAFWVGGIESCGDDQQCREVKRIDTSAAFFLSIEFQETGYLVERAYRAAFNRRVLIGEFLPDSQEIGSDVVVGQPGFEGVLEANKQAYFDEFVTRQQFASVYNALTNEQFVDALNANTGGALSQSERNALVAALNGGTATRARALRSIVEDSTFAASEFNRAFVLMQYFGYLRRDPDEAGFNFWLTKLNQFNGDFRAAEMVKAFISSIEYRQRFGQ